MKRSFLLLAVLSAMGVAPASVGAQDGVPSFLELSVTQPTDGFASFPSRKAEHAYLLAIAAQVTATEAPVLMTMGDGDAPDGSHHGRLIRGSSALPAPLQASVGTTAFASLDATADPLIAQWVTPITRAPAPIRLRQQVGEGAALSGFHKLLLITVSTESP
jgi:hypothetical protein